MRRVAALIGSLVLVAAAGPLVSTSADALAGTAQGKPASAKYADAAHAATNANRKQNGLRALRKNDCLRKFANRQATLMAQREQMFHQELGPVLKSCGLNTAGENVAYGYRSGTSVVNDGWMNSEGHRANILNPDFTLEAIGARKGHDGRWYVAQVFGRRA